MKLIEGAKQWWRLWSVRLNALGLALLTWFALDPVALLSVWQMMPPEVRGRLPGSSVAIIGAVLFALSMIARLVRQPKLDKAKPDGN